MLTLLCNRGNAMVDLRRLEEALASYDQALAINPKDAPTLNNVGNVLWALNRREEALQSYESALAVNPNDLSTLKDRGTALYELETSRRKHWRVLIGLWRSSRAISTLFSNAAALLIDLNRYEEALECFDRLSQWLLMMRMCWTIAAHALAALNGMQKRSRVTISAHDRARISQCALEPSPRFASCRRL